MGRERGANLVRRVGPFHAGIEALSVLTEDDDIDGWFFEASVSALANEIQRISWKRDARANTGVEVEPLPHGHNRAEIGISLAPQFGTQFGLGLFFRFGGDRAKQAQ